MEFWVTSGLLEAYSFGIPHQTPKLVEPKWVTKKAPNYHICNKVLVSTHLKNIGQMESFPQIGMKYKKICETTT